MTAQCNTTYILEMVNHLVKVQGDFPFFCQTFIDAEGKPFDWYDYHDQIYNFIIENNEAMILAPRKLGKSVAFNTGFSLFHAIKNPNIRIGIISNTENQAKKFIKPILQHLESPKFISVFGDLIDSKSEKKITLKRNTITKEATISSYSVQTGGFVGEHFDILILDDIVDMENCNAYQTQKLDDFFNSSILPTLESNGKLIIIGTHYSNIDFYTRKKKEGFPHIRLQAIQLDSDGNEYSINENILPIATLLERRKRMGNIIFSAQYQNDTVLMQSGNLIKPYSIQYYQTRNPEKENYINIYDNENIRYIQTIDLAVGGKERKDDYSVCAMIAYDSKTKEIYLDDIVIEKMPVSEFKPRIKNQWEKYRKYYPQSYCEANGFQTSILQDINSTFSMMRIQPVKNTINKYSRFVGALSPVFDDMKIRLNQNCVYMPEAVNQFLALTANGSTEHDDAPDVVTMAIEKINKGSGNAVLNAK